MLSLDQTAETSVYVEQTILSWVRLHPQFSTVTDLSQICDGKFLIATLSTLPNFKLQSPLNQNSQAFGLAAKVVAIKNISKSLMSYHQAQLLRDVSELDINYVELCMGSKKELFRLITLTLSALCSHHSSRELLDQQMAKLPEEHSQIMRIMIENSLNLGHECGSCSSRSWRLSEQKKVFAKMELLENKIEELEIINRNLEEVLRAQKQSEEAVLQDNRKMMEQIKNLLALNQELAESREKAINELKISSIEQNTAKKKFEVVKAGLEDKVHKLQRQIGGFDNLLEENRVLREKLECVTEINREIRDEHTSLREALLRLEKQRVELKQTEKTHVQELTKLKQHCGELEIKIEQLKLACSFRSDEADTYQKTCYFGKRSQEQDDSNRYRIKESLGWLNQNHQGSDEKQKNSLFEIRTITEKSMEESSCLEHLKQNQSILMNSSDLATQPFSKKETKLMGDMGQGYGDYGELQGGEGEGHYRDEIKVLTCVILDLQAQLQEAYRRNPLVCMQNSSVSFNRMEKFKSKVKEMFHR